MTSFNGTVRVCFARWSSSAINCLFCRVNSISRKSSCSSGYGYGSHSVYSSPRINNGSYLLCDLDQLESGAFQAGHWAGAWSASPFRWLAKRAVGRRGVQLNALTVGCPFSLVPNTDLSTQLAAPCQHLSATKAASLLRIGHGFVNPLVSSLLFSCSSILMREHPRGPFNGLLGRASSWQDARRLSQGCCKVVPLNPT